MALYAEFGFEGALIANNLVDTAATGISVTNFNDGGRLAVVQGNLVRNLFRREHEPVDKRGHGITVEADTALSGNVIESAPSAGIVIGWGTYMREVVATANLVRARRRHPRLGHGRRRVPARNNMISGATDGAIRAMDGSTQRRRPRADARRRRRQAAVDRPAIVASSRSDLEPGERALEIRRGADGAHLDARATS